MNKKITGVLPALLTSFDEKGNIKQNLAEELVDFYVKERADGLYMLGYTGEGAYMNVAQRKEWAEAVVGAGKGKLPLIVHVGYSENTKDGIELAEHAGRIGVDAVSSVGVSAEASLKENIEYFKRVSEVSGLPFYIYWNSFAGNLNTGERFDPDELLEAMREVKTFTGIKFTDSNFYYLDRLKQYNPELTILTGVDTMCIGGSLSGSDGAIGALQAVTAKHMKVMWEKFKEGKVDEAKDLQIRANNIYEALDKRDVGGLIPGLKAVIEHYYNIPVGHTCANAPFKKIEDKKIIDRILKVYDENILKS